MKFLFVDPQQCIGNRIILDRAQSHHLCHVLRVQEGEFVNFIATDGSLHWSAFLLESHRKGASFEIDTAKELTLPPKPSLTLAIALLKGDAMDRALRMAVEVGANRIVLLACERSIRRLDAKRAVSTLARWETLIREACQQCGRLHIPQILPPITPRKFFAKTEPDRVLVLFTLDEEAKPLRDLERSKGEDFVVLVGPEGDFSPTESKDALAAGAFPVHLTGGVLRADTAAAVCLALVAHQLRKF